MHVTVSIILDQGETFETPADEVATSVHEVLELDSEEDTVAVQISQPPIQGLAGKLKKEREAMETIKQQEIA